MSLVQGVVERALQRVAPAHTTAITAIAADQSRRFKFHDVILAYIALIAGFLSLASASLCVGAEPAALVAASDKQISAATSPRLAAVTAIPTNSAQISEFNHSDWPFRPLTRPMVPQLVDLRDWGRNPIDNFIGQKLEAAKLTPNSPADKSTLLRRVTFDLTGLPPTVAEQAAFFADNSPDAYARVVDRLLASPHYGEHWAQHWHDLVRFSETEGFKKDGLRPDAYKYRDYVIRSFNNDLPYDRFLRQQLAGDELEPDNPDALIATGLLRLYPEDVIASNMVQQRQEILDDITENTGLALLGLTVGCARCHDHKFDAITQVDYYRLQACFAAILPNDEASTATREQAKIYSQRLSEWETATKPIRDNIDRELADEREQARQDAISAYDPETLAAINTPEGKRTCLQDQLVAEADAWIESRIDRAYRRCAPEERKLYDQQMEELASYDALKPEPLPTAMAISDGDDEAPKTCVLASGNYLKPEQEVTPGFPAFLGASEPQIAPPPGEPNSTGRRSALAHWLTRPDHPLTARVFVNRIWQYHFGQGIVATPNDFGVMGGNPSHPELLDWLASEFVANGWCMKPIHRLIVLSATYCQSSLVDASTPTHAAAIAADGANNLLWHARRQRLQGESLRDAMLQVSGQLELSMFGPSVRPELPQALADSRYGWESSPSPADRNRRSIYVLVQRNMRLPMLAAFDQPDLLNSCPRRTNTITAPQALEMLNSDVTAHAAREWSGKLLYEFGTNVDALVREAYAEAFGRPPLKREIEVAEQFVEHQEAVIDADSVALDDEQLPIPLPKKLDRAKAAAFVDFCHALLCSNEFLYVD